MDRRPASPARRAGMLAVALACACVLAACKPAAEPGDAATAEAPAADAGVLFPPDQDSERTWVGLLPCSDCQGVDTRLVLRVHGGRRDYLLTETYLAAGGSQRFNRAGDWTESKGTGELEGAVLFQLDPAQSGQRYVVQPDGALELLDGNGRSPADPIANRLQRL